MSLASFLTTTNGSSRKTQRRGYLPCLPLAAGITPTVYPAGCLSGTKENKPGCFLPSIIRRRVSSLHSKE
ncbi:hypothetical protein VDGL01_00728 [Verticillium dahliae]